MSRHGRARACRRAVGVVVVAVAAVVALAGGGTADQARPTRQTDRSEPSQQPLPTRSSPSVPSRGTEPRDPPASADARLRAQPVARRFLRGFIRYQAGRLNADTRQALRTTSTPRLARALLLRPPRLPGRALGLARVRALDVIGPFGGRLKAIARLSYPALGEGLLELVIADRGARLRVTRLYP
jgi:hypothetical protein